jgi:RNA polymerase sigma-70 factor (ECF subfamily)
MEPAQATEELARLEQKWDRWTGMAFTLTQDWDAAEDALQEAFLAAVRAIGRLKEDANVGGWFYRILVNCCMNEHRRQGRHPTLSLHGSGDEQGEIDPPDPNGDPAEKTAADEVNRVCEILRRHCDEVTQEIVLNANGLSGKELGEELGLSAATVNGKRSRALKELRLILDPNCAASAPEAEAAGEEGEGAA